MYAWLTMLLFCSFSPPGRPPYGDVDDRIRAIAQGMGLQTIMWSDDTNDVRTFNDAMCCDETLTIIPLLLPPSGSSNHMALNQLLPLKPITQVSSPRALHLLQQLVVSLSSSMNWKVQP